MPRALRVCSVPGCHHTTTSGRCQACTTQADRARGTARQRYDSRHDRVFRPGVLKRHPLCVCETPGHGHTGQCLLPSRVADHYPRSRRELIVLGLDPNDPQHGRGLCDGCHNRHTATAQPGGWNARK